MTQPIIVAVDPRHEDAAPAALGAMFAQIFGAPFVLAATYAVDLSIENLSPTYERAQGAKAERAVEHYNMMGPVKAALESSMRYVAAELGPKHIRAHAISPGPIRTRAASGIDQFDELLEAAAARAPEHHLVDIADVGNLAAFLVSDAARCITGTIIPVDGGEHLAA